MRAAVRVGLALGLFGALGGCRSLPTVGPVRAALTTAGYQVEALEPMMGRGGSHVGVRVASAMPQEGETGTVAGVAWTTIPFRFQHLDVTVDGPHGQQQETLTYAQLADRFGPRLPELDRRDYGRAVRTLTDQLLAGVALPAVLLGAGLGGFVLFSTWPSTRRRPGPGAA